MTQNPLVKDTSPGKIAPLNTLLKENQTFLVKKEIKEMLEKGVIEKFL